MPTLKLQLVERQIERREFLRQDFIVAETYSFGGEALLALEAIRQSGNVPDMATPDHPNTPLVRNLARRLAELLPGAAPMRVIRAWGGIVENTPDGLPVIDRLSSPDNVILATMSSVGFGLLARPAEV